MRSLAVILLLGLAGCAGPQRPAPPEAAIVPPPSWRGELQGSEPVTADWFRQFGDDMLSATIEAALAHNVDIAIAVARVREARAQVALANAQSLPTVDASAPGSHGRSVSPFGTPVESSVGQPTLQLSYEVDLFGRIDSQKSAARSNWLASAAARDATRLSIASATASAYITLVGLDARRAVVQRTIDDRSAGLRLAQSRARVGYTSQLELQQAESEYRAATVILPQVDNAIARAENALRLLTGDVPGTVIRAASLSSLAMPAVPDAGLPSDLLLRRPDIAQAEQSLAASDATLAVARKQFLPTVRLTASAGAVLNSALPDPISIWSVGGSILAPIFEGGRLTANVDAAASRRDQAAFAYRKAALTAFREVEDAEANVVNLTRQRTETEAQRVAIVEALRHATNRYRAGYSSYLDQLDAQRALLSADLSLVQLRVDQATSIVSLYQALGGGWAQP